MSNQQQRQQQLPNSNIIRWFLTQVHFFHLHASPTKSSSTTNQIILDNQRPGQRIVPDGPGDTHQPTEGASTSTTSILDKKGIRWPWWYPPTHRGGKCQVVQCGTLDIDHNVVKRHKNNPLSVLTNPTSEGGRERNDSLCFMFHE